MVRKIIVLFGIDVFLFLLRFHWTPEMIHWYESVRIPIAIGGLFCLLELLIGIIDLECFSCNPKECYLGSPIILNSVAGPDSNWGSRGGGELVRKISGDSSQFERSSDQSNIPLDSFSYEIGIITHCSIKDSSQQL